MEQECEHEHYDVIQAHPYQRLVPLEGVPDTFYVAESGDDIECRCLDCGRVFYEEGARYYHDDKPEPEPDSI